jgi:hypothetical protein
MTEDMLAVLHIRLLNKDLAQEFIECIPFHFQISEVNKKQVFNFLSDSGGTAPCLFFASEDYN